MTHSLVLLLGKIYLWFISISLTFLSLMRFKFLSSLGLCVFLVLHTNGLRVFKLRAFTFYLHLFFFAIVLAFNFTYLDIVSDHSHYYSDNVDQQVNCQIDEQRPAKHLSSVFVRDIFRKSKAKVTENENLRLI